MMTTEAETIARALDKNFRSSGDGYVCRCPAHNDDKPSLKISMGKDDKVLVHCHAGCDPQAVIGEIKARGLWPERPAPERPAPKPRAARATIVQTYDYYDHQTGELLMQVCRMEPKSFRQRRPDGNGGWLWTVGPEHRTLYRGVEAFKHDKVVFVVEGEKDVETLADLKLVAVCNPGGAGKWQDSYNEILRGKDVVILPDNDDAGRNHASVVGSALHGVARRVRVLALPDLDDKQDVSDWVATGGTRAQLAELIKTAPEWSPPVAPPAPPAANDNTPPPANDNERPYTCLGYNRGTYYYIGAATQQVIELTPGAHTANNLMQLAPLRYWEMEFPAKSGFDLSAANDHLMQNCHRKGIFSAEDTRGRGAWYDQGRIVVHCGDRLYVDRVPTSVSAIQSRYVYERALPMKVAIDSPLSAGEAQLYLEHVQRLPWARPMDALYAAGWCALAHIGGVLNWRPHIWLVGGKGTGKSYTLDQVIKPLFGPDRCLPVAGSTTEAGIRQTLGSDAIPVLFDEAEGENNKANENLQNTLTLVRQSSSETGSKLVKGSATGNATGYQIRSCFMFASINASLVQQSDRSRITVLELRKENQRFTLDELNAAGAFLLNDTYAQRFQARSIALAAVIRQNAKVFANVVAGVMGEQRAGDQLGTLLAGAWSLQSDAEATYDEAKAWVQQFDWTDEKAEVDSMSDEAKLLQELLSAKMRVPVKGAEGIERDRTLPISEIVPMSQDPMIDKMLRAEGIKVLCRSCWDDEGHLMGAKVFIAKDAPGIKKLLKGTPWEHADYAKVLARLPNAEPAKQPTHFPGMGTKRGVEVELPV